MTTCLDRHGLPASDLDVTPEVSRQEAVKVASASNRLFDTPAVAAFPVALNRSDHRGVLDEVDRAIAAPLWVVGVTGLNFAGPSAPAPPGSPQPTAPSVHTQLSLVDGNTGVATLGLSC
jgi:hypothetical protein